MRYKLTLEYDGTDYAGWQKQQNAATVQGTLIEAISRVLAASGGSYADLQGSGRTDAGVHASGQVAHLDCETSLKPQVLLKRINEALPEDIALLTLEPADPRFHARHWASYRQYVYRISRRPSVFERRYAHVVTHSLDLKAMKAAAELMQGMHDFSSYSGKPAKETSTRVLLESITITESHDLILIRVRGSHFLWNMVRILVGTLIEVGRGRLDLEQISMTLDDYTPDLVQLKAPAKGLCLEKVKHRKQG